MFLKKFLILVFGTWKLRNSWTFTKHAPAWADCIQWPLENFLGSPGKTILLLFWVPFRLIQILLTFLAPKGPPKEYSGYLGSQNDSKMESKWRLWRHSRPLQNMHWHVRIAYSTLPEEALFRSRCHWTPFWLFFGSGKFPWGSPKNNFAILGFQNSYWCFGKSAFQN